MNAPGLSYSSIVGSLVQVIYSAANNEVRKVACSAFDYSISSHRNAKISQDSIVENNFEEWLTDKMEKYYKDFLGKYLFSEGSTNVLYSNLELEYLANTPTEKKGRYLKTLSLKNMRIAEINSDYRNYVKNRASAHPHKSTKIDSFSILSMDHLSISSHTRVCYEFIKGVCTISSFIIEKKGGRPKILFFLYHPKENIVFFEVQELYHDSEERKWYLLHTITKSVTTIVSKRKYSSFVLRKVIFPLVKYRMKKFDCDMNSITTFEI